MDEESLLLFVFGVDEEEGGKWVGEVDSERNLR